MIAQQTLKNTDNKLTHSFYSIAKYFLTQKVRYILEQLPYSFFSEDMEDQIEELEKELLVTQRQQTLLSVVAIQKYCEASIKSAFSELKSSYILKIVRQSVKQVIRSIIQQELNSFAVPENFLKMSDIQDHQSLSVVSKVEKSKSNRVTIRECKKQKRSNQQRNKKNPSIQIKFQESNSVPFSKEISSEYQRYNSSNYKQPTSQRPFQEIEDNYRSQKDSEQIDCLDQTSIYGHFLYGDTVDQIHQIFPVQDQIYVLIYWNSRINGFLPKPSSLRAQIVRIHAPTLLAQYYERFLQQRNMK